MHLGCPTSTKGDGISPADAAIPAFLDSQASRKVSQDALLGLSQAPVIFLQYKGVIRLDPASGFDMALEIFALLDMDGCDNCKTYIVCGKPTDMRGLARPLQEFYAANKRKKKVEALATRIIEAAQLPKPLIRLEPADGLLLMDIVSGMGEGKKPSHAFAKLLVRLENCLAVY